ncbi:MAG TPA: proline--tRNA ligase, partial [Acidimicrobiaceae bacterium]|nr:proline--tRNA ligase [Acidimicrobiaceae bacterium]
DEDGAGGVAEGIHDELVRAGVRSRLDDRVETAFGRRSTDWELKGVPIRLEIGPRDVADGQAVLVRRDTGEKTPVPLTEIATTVPRLLEQIQADLLAEATTMRDERTTDVDSVEGVLEAAATGFARGPW